MPEPKPEEVDRPLKPDEVLDVVGDYPVYIDLFAGIGGVCRGLYRFPCARPTCDVIGIDIDGSKAEKYPGYFVEYDLTEGLPEFIDELSGIDMGWASPACTFATDVQYARSGENMIPLARDLLAELDAEITVIENVPAAAEHLDNPVQFCGSAFGLGVKKHRLFETSFYAHGVPCDHPDGKFDFCIGDREHPVEEYRAAHGFRRGCDLTAKELREAIPPAYVWELLDQYIRYAGTGAHKSVADPATDRIPDASHSV